MTTPTNQTKKPLAQDVPPKAVAPVAAKPPTDPAVARVEQLLQANRAHVAALLGTHMTPEQLFTLARLAMSRVPKLKECTVASVLGCVMEAARWGLQPGAGPGETWIIPYDGVATLIVDYRGLIKLMKRDAGVYVVIAEPVHAEDLFERGVDARGPFLRWVPESTLAKRGAVEGYFAAAWDREGRLLGSVYLTVAEIDARSRSRSKSGSQGPWARDPDWMYRKSVLRPLAKLLPGLGQGEVVSRATAVDERAELGLPQDLHLLADPAAAPTPEAKPESAGPGPISVSDLVPPEDARG